MPLSPPGSLTDRTRLAGGAGMPITPRERLARVLDGSPAPGAFSAQLSVRWARAGHLPPILVRDAAARTLSLPCGVLVGADPDAAHQEVTTSLQPGDVLVLFTDGLVERHDESIDDSLQSLLRI